MYKCLKSDFDKLSKKINRITKKLDDYGLEYEFKVLGESVELINVIDISIANQPVIKSEMLVDVVSYEFTMKEIKLGNYKAVAVIEHNRIDNSDENLIHLLDPLINLDKKYRNIPSHCEHCNTNRRRNKTILLKDVENSANAIKQVGSTCLKDYTGIEAMDIIGNYIRLNDLFLEEIYVNYENHKSYPKYVETLAYLANCIKLIGLEGYKKDATKEKAWAKTLAGDNNSNKYNSNNSKYIKKAEEVLNYFENKNFDGNNFLMNIKLILQNKYNKMSGFVAYAYLAYEKQLELEEAEKLNSQSKYVGIIGDRSVFKVSLLARYSFEGYYGYQNIYLFKDCNNNVYKWTTGVNLLNSKDSSIEIGDEISLTGTIKSHEEYKGTKQTELTRCKLSK